MQHPLKRLLASYSNRRRAFVLAATCSVANKFFDVLPEVLIGVAVDVVVNKQKSFLATLGIENELHQLFALGGLTAAIWAFESGFEYAYSILWRNLAQNFQHDLRLQAFTKIQNLEMSYFENSRTGNLLALANDDVNQLERFLDSGASELIQVATTVILIGGIFLYVNPSLAALAFMPIPIILIGAFWFQRRIAPLYSKVRECASDINSQIENSVSGIMTVRSFTRETAEIARIEDLSLSYQKANARAIALSSAFIPVIRMAILFGFIVTLLYGGWLTFEQSISVGSFSMLIFLTQRLLWPLTGLARTADLYERAMASLTRVLDLINRPVQMIDGTKEIALTSDQCSIAFSGVGFSYLDSSNSETLLQPVFQKLDLKFEPGKVTGLVGTTGAGKSSIVKLLLRLYDPQRGQITLAGIPLPDFRLESLRQTIGLVNQDIFLFHGSITENIRYGKPTASMNEVVRAAKLAEAHEFIESLREGYDTIVGERGIKLSGGQRQRITLARALIKDAPVLIFDEATSAVDNETEAAIQRSLSKVCQNRTTLVIAHRLSTVRHAHCIHVLENGHVMESGTHDELVQIKNGLYAKLWSVQSATT